MIFIFGHLFLSSAFAAPVDVELVDDGSVKVSCLINAPMSAVKGAIANPLLMMDFSTDLKIEEKGLIDECRVIDYQTTWSNYKVKMCPVDKGFNFDLISSASLSDFWTRWRFDREGEGVRVAYQIMVKTKIPLPRNMMQQRLKKDVEIFFEEFKRYVE